MITANASQGLLEQSFMKITITAITTNKSRINAGIIMNIAGAGLIIIILLLDKAFEAKSFVFGGRARPDGYQEENSGKGRLFIMSGSEQQVEGRPNLLRIDHVDNILEVVA